MMKSAKRISTAKPDHGQEPVTGTLHRSGFEAASPLVRLYTRRDQKGGSGIGAAAFAAGERLRADLTFAGMMPKTTMDWSGAGSVDKSRTIGTLNPTEASIAARQRADHALRAVGPDFAGLLMDLCGFCKGLETIEMERGWPQRSAKIAVQFALSALARHYGLSDVAMGKDSTRIRRWTSPEPPSATEIR